MAVEGDATWIDERGGEVVEEHCERAAVAEVDQQVVDAEQAAGELTEVKMLGQGETGAEGSAKGCG